MYPFLFKLTKMHTSDMQLAIPMSPLVPRLSNCVFSSVRNYGVAGFASPRDVVREISRGV